MAMPPPRAMAPVFAGSAPMMARPTPLAMAGNNAMMGRTLDSYRLRPVAVVAPPPAMIR
jgi:hypothetical protein